MPEPKPRPPRSRYRYPANLSPIAYLKMLKVMELLHELDMPFEISVSTTIEFMHAIMEAYHKRERLDVANWRPQTRLIRKRYLRRRKPRGNGLKKIADIARAEAGGLQYIKDKIQKVENVYKSICEERGSHWKKLQRGNAKYREEKRRQEGPSEG